MKKIKEIADAENADDMVMSEGALQFQGSELYKTIYFALDYYKGFNYAVTAGVKLLNILTVLEDKSNEKP